MRRRAFLATASLGLLAAACDPVSLARRLLMAGGGSGSFPAPASLSAFALTTAPAGGWCWFNGPSAVRSSAAGKTYLGYLKGTNGDLCLRTVDDTTRTVGSEAVIYPAFERDDHDAPSILVKASDGTIAMAYTIHVGDLYYGDGASAGALPPAIPDARQRNITSSVGARSGSAGYTYAGLAQVSAVANTLFLFFRWHDSGGTAHLAYSKSTDNGTTWGARVNVCVMTYHQFAVNGSDRIDFVVSNHPQDAGNHDIRHLYFVPSTEKWYTSAGVEITATKPFDYTYPTQVYDGSTTMGWLWDIAIASGSPRIVYATFPGAVPGTSATDHRYNYAAWNGSAWPTHEIVAAGGRIPTGDQPAGNHQEFYSGGVCLDHADPSVVYASVEVGSGRWDMYRYTTADAGATWSSVALTSSGKNIRPIAVQGAHPSLEAIWFEGTYTTYIDYSLRTMGAGV